RGAARPTGPAIWPAPTASGHSTNMKSACVAPWANAWRISPNAWSLAVAKTPKALPELDWLIPRMKLSRALSLFNFVALLLLLLVWNLWFADLHGARPWVVLSIQLLPLLLLAPGILLGNARAHAW